MLPEILACNYCNVGFCEMHGRFIATCRKCHTDRCDPCKVFNIQMDTLMRTSGEHGKKIHFQLRFRFFKHKQGNFEAFLQYI